jgi:hypothetical protein
VRIKAGRRRIPNKKMFMFVGANIIQELEHDLTLATYPYATPQTTNVASSEKDYGKLRNVRNVEMGRKHMAGNKRLRVSTAI